MVFRRPGGYLIALTYGPETDWVQNILAAGTAILIYRGHEVPISDPVLEHGGEARQMLPFPVRTALGLLRVDNYLTVRSP